MILAIDIGNTNIVVGCIEEEKIYFIERISTDHTKTELEYAIALKTILDIHHIKRSEIEGAIISSVVPQITNAAKLAVEKILKKEPMVLGPGVKTGLNIVLDNPARDGSRPCGRRSCGAGTVSGTAGHRGYGNSDYDFCSG